jgi:hypothetical protein
MTANEYGLDGGFATVGVPEIVPEDAFSVRPGGNAVPLSSAHTGFVASFTTSVSL